MARGAKTIDRKEWTNMLFTSNDIATETTTAGGSVAFAIPGTVLRVRGYVQAMFDESAQVTDRMIVTFGLGLFSTDAVALGATALPEPKDEPEYPWLWWGEMHLQSNATAGPISWGPTAQRLEVDSRAMRKFKPRESLSWVIQTTLDVGAPVTIISTGTTRVLIGT